MLENVFVSWELSGAICQFVLKNRENCNMLLNIQYKTKQNNIRVFIQFTSLLITVLYPQVKNGLYERIS